MSVEYKNEEAVTEPEGEVTEGSTEEVPADLNIDVSDDVENTDGIV